MSMIFERTMLSSLWNPDFRYLRIVVLAGGDFELGAPGFGFEVPLDDFCTPPER